MAAALFADAIEAARTAGSARIAGSVQAEEAEESVRVELSGVQVFDPPAADITFSSEAFGTTNARVIFTGGKAYAQMPNAGDQWFAIDLTSLQVPLGPVLSGFDPAAVPDLSPAGEDVVNGAPVKRYTAELDFAKALEASGLEGTARLADDPGQGTITVAIDEQGRLVQLQVDASVKLADGRQRTSVTELTFSDFGVAADIAAPADAVDIGSIPMPLGN